MTSFLKTGIEAAKEFAKDEKAFKAAKASSHKTWRFRLEPGEECTITFVDGHLSPEGILLAPSCREHSFKMGGTFYRFPCTVEKEGVCPLCDQFPDDKPPLVAALTVIDHRVTKSKDGQKTFKDQPRFFVMKSFTRRLLQSLATMGGGLAGATFKVARATNPKSPAVGTSFDFVGKADIDTLKDKFSYPNKEGSGRTTYFKPVDYESEFAYVPAKELRDLGFGGGTSIGGESALDEDDGQDVPTSYGQYEKLL